MSERLSVAVRVRPFLPNEPLESCVAVRENQITIGQSKSFAFDRVFDMHSTSDDVYVALGQPLADAFLGGYHASTIAYGQTGAGKTFTMAALLNDTIQEIFCRLAEDEEREKTKNEGGCSSDSTVAVAGPSPSAPYAMSLTVLEVYNEAVGDLLSKHAGPASTAGVSGGHRGSFAQDKKIGGAAPRTSALQLREDPTGGVYVVGLTEVAVENEGRLLALIDDAIGNRKTASTLMNATSSRSHCVITLTLQRRGLCSRCCFVDLAGSERLKKSLGFGSPTDRQGSAANGNNVANGITSPMDGGVGGPGNAAVRMREGININSGLLALGNVIVALCERRPHVPYRSSKLTRLLQPMLEGHARTAMVACVAPVASSLEETLNTLKYADRAKRIQINPQLAVAAATSADEAQHLIFMLREQLEEARLRLAAVGSGPQSSTSISQHHSAAQDAELAHLRELLAQEQQVTKRLEDDLFNAEYTAMVEVEKRKALEERVAQLEAAAHEFGAEAAYAGSERTSVDFAAFTAAAGAVGRSGSSPPSPHARLTQNMARLQQLEEERDTLAALRARRVRDTERLEAAIAAGASTDSTDNSSDGMTMAQLTEEIQQKEDQIARLQRENEEVVSQLAQYERELHDALSEKAKLQDELKRAEAQLERSAMETEQKEQEKTKLRASYVERIRKAESRATEYRRRVREAEQEMRTRTESIDRTRQLQERIMQLREEVTRQRAEVRHTRKQSDHLSAAHQHEVLQLQKQLHMTTAQLSQLHQRMDRKDAAIAKIKKQLVQQQQQQQQQQSNDEDNAESQSTSQQPQQQQQPPQLAAHVAMHKIPPRKQAHLAAVRRSSTKTSTPSATPPTLSLSDIPSGGSSPVRVTKRRLTLSSLHVAPPSTPPRDTATQALIDRELQDLERMERELAELQEYRQVLLSAHTNDAPKWHRAKEGFTRRLAVLQAELQTTSDDDPRRDILAKEEHDVREKLRQLQTYQHMFEDADQQLAEFENRIENLNEARKYHLRRIRRLQQTSRTAADPADTAATSPCEDTAVSQPSVREIRTARLAYATHSVPPSPQGPTAAQRRDADVSSYVAALERQVAQLSEETQALRAQLHKA